MIVRQMRQRDVWEAVDALFADLEGQGFTKVFIPLSKRTVAKLGRQENACSRQHVCIDFEEIKSTWKTGSLQAFNLFRLQ